MFRRLVLFLLVFIGVNHFGRAGDAIIYGEIGKYPIQMQITSVDWESGEIIGKYRYESKERYLSLKGELLGECVFLEESSNGEVTGSFYLEMDDLMLVGKWVSGKSWYPVELNITEEIRETLRRKEVADFADETSASITGSYQTEHYYVNDWFFTEENPELEIGFSGGSLDLKKLSEDSLQFRVEVVCGPTYHFAGASGIALKTVSGNYECLLDIWDEDTCRISITPSEKSAYVEATGTRACEFGARAYLAHTFGKVSDVAKIDRDL